MRIRVGSDVWDGSVRNRLQRLQAATLTKLNHEHHTRRDRNQIAGLKTSTTKSNVGIVRETGDGVARIEGLSDVMLNEMIEFRTASSVWR